VEIHPFGLEALEQQSRQVRELCTLVEVTLQPKSEAFERLQASCQALSNSLSEKTDPSLLVAALRSFLASDP
jgi:hypothetical protein